MSNPSAVIFVFHRTALSTAREIEKNLPGARIWGFASRLPDAPQTFTDTTKTLQENFLEGRPIIGLCAAGILVRALGPVLAKMTEPPPVLSVSEDGDIIVPLMGGPAGANDLAERLATCLSGTAAITGTGTRRFGVTLAAPPEGWRLMNPEAVKRVTSDILAGARVRLEGSAPWLEHSRLPLADDGEVLIRIGAPDDTPPENGLLYVPPAPAASQPSPHAKGPKSQTHKRGDLAIVGLGPGGNGWLTAAARQRLEAATDIVGYETYLKLLPDLGRPWRLHGSGNRVELDRARTSLDLAAEGRRVALVTSGDPGIFAMAAAVMEALEADSTGRWSHVAIHIEPGISAMQAAAARTGALLGQDFCVLSLSDIRKPWSLIEKRLEAALTGDFALALYNPASRSRRAQLHRALALIRQWRKPDTPLVVAKNLGREGESVEITTLGRYDPDSAHMRTLLLVGANQSRRFRQANGREWVYSPRSAPAAQEPASPPAQSAQPKESAAAATNMPRTAKQPTSSRLS